MTVKQRIKEIINQLGISQKEFEKRIGASNGYVNSIAKSIGAEYLRNICREFPNINEDWLLYGEGNMLKDENDTAEIVGVASNVMSDNAVIVKFFDVNPSATFQELDESVSQGYDTLEVVPIHGERIDDTYVVFEIHGDSMVPTLLSHARILCKEIPEQRWQYAEGVVVISYRDKVVVKRIAVNDILGNSMITLKSDNPDYGSEDVQLSDIHCIYKAKRIISQDIF
ncbi:S24 family peptidase [uncultured Muribaculum sp.]|uniref:XRE family transcriptional regulator n=1 Tax=uncultured Muribaculum sp. TaxID=1918613 RepID=UPI0025B0A65F|nr:S24 family peptidase [uncultured Muribaculum sp.]